MQRVFFEELVLMVYFEKVYSQRFRVETDSRLN